jgi:DNA-binding HxlR family transcriptional regulator
MCRESSCADDVECLCPIRGIIDVVSKKWSICIISLLEKENSLRYSEIKNKLDISPKSLSNALKELEREGLVKRYIRPEAPPRVEYSLSDKGFELKIRLMPLVEWMREAN